MNYFMMMFQVPVKYIDRVVREHETQQGKATCVIEVLSTTNCFMKELLREKAALCLPLADEVPWVNVHRLL